MLHLTMIDNQLKLAQFDEKKHAFMLLEYSELVSKYAYLMHIRAPKNCERCSQPLNVKELSWRLNANIDNFLCYHCIGKLEQAGAMLEHNDRGMWTLKNESIKHKQNA